MRQGRIELHHAQRLDEPVGLDGQHLPRDIAKFLPLIMEERPEIIVGSRDFNTDHVPASSRFGRSVANFWLRIET